MRYRSMALNTFITFINELQSSSSINFKKEVLQKYRSDETVKKLLYYAYNPYYNYYVTKPEIAASGYDLVEFTGLHLDKFFSLLDSANSRETTPAQLQLSLQRLLEGKHQNVIQALIAVVKRDIKAGVNIKTINEVIPSLIPFFSVMLAGKIKDEADTHTLTYPITISPKLDGYRGAGMKRHGEYDVLSREGRVLEKYTEVFRPKLTLLNSLYGDREYAVFDSEVKAVNYKETSVGTGKKSTVALKMHVFDYLDEDTSRKPYVQRITDLHRLRTIIQNNNLADYFEIVLPRVVRNPQELKEAHYANLEAGYEGSMVKSLYHSYEWDRSSEWLKYKPHIDVGGYVVEVLEGDEDGKYVGTLGSIVVEGEDENGNKFRVNCGSGFTDKERDAYWKIRNEIIGWKVDLEAQEFSQDKDGNWSLRFPVFSKFRTK